MAALEVDTVCFCWPPADMNFFIILALKAWYPNIPPNRTPAHISIINIRFFILNSP
jgi:hypothetical protein